jgi:hypothetical protein
MNRAFALVAALIGASWATAAFADPPQLKGDYAFTGTATCLVSPNGFNVAIDDQRPSDYASNGGISFTRSFSVEGIRTFDGAGNGTVNGTAVSIVGRPTNQAVAPNVSSADFNFNFTYVVNGDGTWTSTMVDGSFNETITSGPRKGQTVTMMQGFGIAPIAGIISGDGKTLTAAHLVPALEKRVFSLNNEVSQEMCHRSRVLMKLNDSGDQGQGQGQSQP